MLDRRQLIAAAALLATGCWPSAPPPEDPRVVAAKRAMAAGAAFLWARENADGAFVSDRYAFMAMGQSLTPFTLLALARVPADVHPFYNARAGKAFGRILAFANAEGAIGFADAAVDYPTYSTALAVRAFATLKPGRWEDHVAPLVGWLKTQQFLAADGWGGHPAEGGFGMGSLEVRTPPDSGHVDLSMTRRALEALAAAGALDDARRTAARGFLGRCRTADGGYVYSPVEEVLNKAGKSEEGPRSYGSATADGLLALLAIGVPATDPEVVAALDRLKGLHTPDENPGLGEGPAPGFARAMRGYYRACSAEVFLALGGPEGWEDGLIDAILAEQKPDGSWQNELTAQKEDDPVVATGFALSALAASLASRGRGGR